MTILQTSPIGGYIPCADQDETDTAAGDKIELSVTPSDPSRSQTLKAIEQSGTLNFWNASEEDIYTSGDGEPV
jgi:hypothetical protein